MSSEYAKPLPIIDSDTEPYWRAAREHRLSLMRCAETGKFIHPPGPGSPFTGGTATEWVDLGGEITGQLYSYIVVHRAFGRGFVQEVPYVVGLVDVDQAPGVRITANVFGVAIDSLQVGMPLRMNWRDVTPDVSLPQWEAV
jgi:uncharacterized OB-fold protein